MKFADFILAHDGDDLAQLALARSRFAAEVDLAGFGGADGAGTGTSGFDLALTTLEVRRKLRDKVPEWYALPSLVYPLRVSGEQCSSTVTARYKAAVAAGAPSETASAPAPCTDGGVLVHGSPDLVLPCTDEVPPVHGNLRLADLTGGLGVDTWAFAQVFGEVLYNEMRPELAAAAEHNFRELGLTNVRVRNCTLVPGSSVIPGSDRVSSLIPGSDPGSPEASVSQILDGFRPDVLFLDPARRASDGRKVFRLEDCQPDVLQLLPELLAACPHVLLKLSPMADITLVCKQLGRVKEVHVVAADGECKELLLLLERDYDGPYSTTIFEDGAIMEIPGQARDEGNGAATQIPGQARNDEGGARDEGNGAATQIPGQAGNDEGGARDEVSFVMADFDRPSFLFEPGKAMMKAGAFEVPGQYGLEKLGKHTHLYVGAEVPAELKPFGKTFRILEVVPLNNRSVKAIGPKYPKADVTARNIPLTSDQLRAKLGVRSGGDVHIFGLHSDALHSNLLLVVQRA